MKLQIQDLDGKVIEEKEIVLSNEDKLIVKFNKDVSLESASNYVEWLVDRLEDDSKVIGVPSGIELTVLKTQ